MVAAQIGKLKKQALTSRSAGAATTQPGLRGGTANRSTGGASSLCRIGFLRVFITIFFRGIWRVSGALQVDYASAHVHSMLLLLYYYHLQQPKHRVAHGGDPRARAVAPPRDYHQRRLAAGPRAGHPPRRRLQPQQQQEGAERGSGWGRGRGREEAALSKRKDIQFQNSEHAPAAAAAAGRWRRRPRRGRSSEGQARDHDDSYSAAAAAPTLATTATRTGTGRHWQEQNRGWRGRPSLQAAGHSRRWGQQRRWPPLQQPAARALILCPRLTRRQPLTLTLPPTVTPSLRRARSRSQSSPAPDFCARAWTRRQARAATPTLTVFLHHRTRSHWSAPDFCAKAWTRRQSRAASATPALPPTAALGRTSDSSPAPDFCARAWTRRQARAASATPAAPQPRGGVPAAAKSREENGV